MEAAKKGQKYENHVASLIRKKLKTLAVRNKGSGNQWQRKNDIYTDLPLAIECKYQQNVKVHEWFAQADEAASFNQTPVLVFANDNHPEDLCVLKFTDFLNFMEEIAQLQAEVEDLRAPVPKVDPVEAEVKRMELEHKIKEAELSTEPVVQVKIDRGAQTCRAGHLADQWGYCMQLDCKYSRGYKPPKKKAKK